MIDNRAGRLYTDILRIFDVSKCVLIFVCIPCRCTDRVFIDFVVAIIIKSITDFITTWTDIRIFIITVRIVVKNIPIRLIAVELKILFPPMTILIRITVPCQLLLRIRIDDAIAVIVDPIANFFGARMNVWIIICTII